MEKRGARIQKLEAEVVWCGHWFYVRLILDAVACSSFQRRRTYRERHVGRYRTWADTYWQQLQHLSAAAAALNQQHMLALSNQNQQMAALAQYQLHVNAAAQLVKSAGGSLPGVQVRRTSHPCLAEGFRQTLMMQLCTWLPMEGHDCTMCAEEQVCGMLQGAANTAGGPFGTASVPPNLAVPTASDLSGT